MPANFNKLSQFWQELKRRKVIKVIAMYAATAFIILEVVDIVAPSLGLPGWTLNLVIILLGIGFPITIILSWIFDVTPEGLMKTEIPKAEEKKNISRQRNRKIISANNIVIIILFVTVCILLYPKIFNQQLTDDIGSEPGISNILIAVLPFSNTKSDPETDYLGFAIADQIIGNLVYMNNLTVRSSGSVRKYDKQVIDPTAAGDSLKVDYVLIGNYLKEANMVRLNFELIKVNTDELIWREHIEVDFNSTFELQDIVSQNVIEGLNIQFSQKELDKIGKDIPQNPLAYEYYLRSISYPFSNEGDQIAIEMLKKSIELDSIYAPAYAQLGARTHRLAQFGLHDPIESIRSENYYLKALSLNKDDIYALSNLAQIYTETARIDEAFELTRQILAINPRNAEAHFSLGYIYRYAGMNNEAIQEMEKAIAIDPENPGFRSIVITYIFAGEPEKSFESSKLFEQNEYILGYQGAALFRMGKKLEAVEYFNRCINMNPDGLQALWVTCMKASIEGNIDLGMEAARQFEKVSIIDPESWYHFAGNYGLLGDRDGCIRALQRTVDKGFYNYPFMLSDSFLDSFRDDEEFQKVLQEAREKHLAFRKNFF
jgi:TolB-like protein/Tfp pilus assembly protein PilF